MISFATSWHAKHESGGCDAGQQAVPDDFHRTPQTRIRRIRGSGIGAELIPCFLEFPQRCVAQSLDAMNAVRRRRGGLPRGSRRTWAPAIFLLVLGTALYLTFGSTRVTSPQVIPIANARAAGERLVVQMKGVEVVFRHCPATKKPFRMGSPSSDTLIFADEKSVDVTISRGFWMAEVECTQKLWGVLMGPADEKWTSGKEDLLPAYNVSHDDVVEFVGRFDEELRRQNPTLGGFKAVLPTEAQWEYAARAGSSTRFCFGDDEAKLGEYAWYEANSGGKHHSVGAKKPNDWGIRDMHGSVYEWTSDWYAETLAGGANPLGPKAGSLRVGRGGGIGASPLLCRSAYRRWFAPSLRYRFLGFRLALVQDGGAEQEKSK